MSLTDNKVREIPVYWEWKLETGETPEEINNNDIEDSKFMGKTMSMQIAVVGEQVLGRPRYTVTFDSNGGETLENNTRLVDAEFELGTLPTLTRDGYIFNGWFTRSDGGSQIDENTKMQYRDVTYYAHWTEKIDYAKDKLVLTNNNSPYVNYVDKNGNTIHCRVLYNDSTHGLQIISANSEETVYLGKSDSNYTTGTNQENAQDSYNNMIVNLNDKAESYINSTYASDARCVGSVATVTNEMMANKDNETLLTNPQNYSYLDTYVSQGYKGTDTNFTEDTTQMVHLGIQNISAAYWLASRYVKPNSRSSIFYGRYIDSSGIVGRGSVWTAYSSGDALAYGPGAGFRSVFLLKSNVTVTGGTGTEDDPFVLGIE